MPVAFVASAWLVRATRLLLSCWYLVFWVRLLHFLFWTLSRLHKSALFFFLPYRLVVRMHIPGTSNSWTCVNLFFCCRCELWYCVNVWGDRVLCKLERVLRFSRHTSPVYINFPSYTYCYCAEDLLLISGIPEVESRIHTCVCFSIVIPDFA